MSKQRDRDEFIAIATKEGIPVDVARKLLRYAATLHRLAELECSSEAADRDRVPCPRRDKPAWVIQHEEGGQWVTAAETVSDPMRWFHSNLPAFSMNHAITCEGWRVEPVPCLCRDYGSYDGANHGTVPRYAVQTANIERNVRALCSSLPGVIPIFQSDPRGAVLKLRVPSGATDDWGICVP